ncbi:MAG: hypothetical protein NTY86_10780 [Deltaproteobacteria bacterium]|nr:hypothetical protein [Deltaproteobacteria bacterium]
MKDDGRKFGAQSCLILLVVLTSIWLLTGARTEGAVELSASINGCGDTCGVWNARGAPRAGIAR